MKIEFEDKSYIDIGIVPSSGKIFIVIGAKSSRNPLESIVNSVEISYDEFNKLITGLGYKKI